MDTLFIAAAAFCAGLIDAIVGGGGLILVPALFSAFPGAAPATLFGTNKGGAIWGTTASMLQYVRRVTLRWNALLPATLAALVGAFAGAWTVTLVAPDAFRRALPFVLAAVLLYTVARKQLGRTHTPAFSGRTEAALGAALGLVIGFYDGFFGPGTGSFLVFAFVRVFGFDFLHASASAKIVNVACNLAALVLFASTGHVWWALAGVIAVCNVAGSLLGTRLALKHGVGFVRVMFIGVVALLIVKTAWDAWLK
ncbi:MAG: TSUP family transporter [Betaproteobacteria bacterium]|nr:TSUP family transporter [Betaproteobacteria bacterium]